MANVEAFRSWLTTIHPKTPEQARESHEYYGRVQREYLARKNAEHRAELERRAAMRCPVCGGTGIRVSQ